MKHYEVYNRITNDYTDLSEIAFDEEGFLLDFDSYDDAYEQVKLWIEDDSKDMIIGDHIEYESKSSKKPSSSKAISERSV